ncbi:hypothetical protein N658DRAFT_7947 [Parathielavia hyrcaniae]|uniref:Uncharacterized protein n=1 Tax=Parathielavia hyrcaniae TaxID=113614 RepID=A0AAN6Q9I1_9PEZI|nr:hypothetical protein N658DRAFT_7947 [Parathielavia hyrcaniae]
MGIILVLVASVTTLSYLYWRFKIKPNLQPGVNASQGRVSGYWEVSGRDPSSVSITIYREPRPQPRDTEHGLTETRAQGRRKGDNGPPCTAHISTNQAVTPLGYAAGPDIHMVPPPPPPILWAAAAPSTIPPPPPFGPPDVLAPGPAPAPLQPGTLGFGTAPVPCQPDVPPPYFGYAAPQNAQFQYPVPSTGATTQPAGAPPPARPPVSPRDIHAETRPATPAAEARSRRRRWFSLGNRFPTVGHARTLSDSSSAENRSRSLSPPPPSVSPPSRNRGRRQPRPPPAVRRETRRRHRPDPSPRSEFSLSSSSTNTSVEAVFDNRRPNPGSRRQHAHHPPGPGPGRDRRVRHDERRDHTDLTPSSDIIIPLPRVRSQQPRRSPSPPAAPRRRPPSPDMQFSSPERRRARVSFEVPPSRDSDVVATAGSSSSSRSPEPPRRSGTRRARRSRSDGYYHGTGRQPSQARRRREPSSMAEQIIEGFDLMRRVLRGGEYRG